jgi:hypothetical protein
MPMNPRLLRPIASGVHPDAAAWRTAVVANGGSVSGSTMKAVSTFCAAIDAAGIRDRFYRLNLFAGTGLNACLVPLYRGQSLTGTQYGNTTDTNSGPFVSGDYTESSGLDPGATNTSKYLQTGISPDDMGTDDGHLSVYSPVARAYPAGANLNMMGTLTASTSRYRIYTANTNNQNPGETSDWGLNVLRSVPQNSYSSGHLVWSQDSVANTNSCVINGVEVTTSAPTASTTSPLANGVGFYVFALNNNGSPFGYVAQSFRSYSIGRAMSSAEAGDYYTALQAFQTALGRNV